jgi:hypothetical protein
MNPYPACKDDDLLDNSSSLVLQKLLNNVVSEFTGRDDCEIGVPRHVVCDLGPCVLCTPLFILFLSHFLCYWASSNLIIVTLTPMTCEKWKWRIESGELKLLTIQAPHKTARPYISPMITLRVNHSLTKRSTRPFTMKVNKATYP